MTDNNQPKKTPMDLWNEIVAKTQEFFNSVERNTEEFLTSVERAGQKSKEALETAGKNTQDMLDSMGRRTMEFFDMLGSETYNLMQETKMKIEDIPRKIKDMIIGPSMEIPQERKQKETKKQTKQHRPKKKPENIDIETIKRETQDLNAAINQTKEELLQTKEELSATKERLGETEQKMAKNSQKLIETEEKLDETKQIIRSLTALQVYLLVAFYQDQLQEEAFEFVGIVKEDLKRLIDSSILKEHENKLVNELLESPKLDFDKEAIEKVIGLLTDKQPQLRKLVSKISPNDELK